MNESIRHLKESFDRMFPIKSPLTIKTSGLLPGTSRSEESLIKSDQRFPEVSMSYPPEGQEATERYPKDGQSAYKEMQSNYVQAPANHTGISSGFRQTPPAKRSPRSVWQHNGAQGIYPRHGSSQISEFWSVLLLIFFFLNAFANPTLNTVVVGKLDWIPL